jgi:hypothetical protein
VYITTTQKPVIIIELTEEEAKNIWSFLRTSYAPNVDSASLFEKLDYYFASKEE